MTWALVFGSLRGILIPPPFLRALDSHTLAKHNATINNKRSNIFRENPESGCVLSKTPKELPTYHQQPFFLIK